MEIFSFPRNLKAVICAELVYRRTCKFLFSLVACSRKAKKVGTRAGPACNCVPTLLEGNNQSSEKGFLDEKEGLPKLLISAKVLKSNFYLEISVKCGTLVALISVPHKEIRLF